MKKLTAALYASVSPIGLMAKYVAYRESKRR